MSQTKTILITGSGGRLGRLLQAAALRDRPDGVRFVFQSRRSSSDVRWSPGDPLNKLPACDTLVALWGRVDGDEAELAENADLARLSQDIATHCGAERVLHMSSAAVYGVGDRFSEESPLQPSKPYGKAKVAREEVVLARIHDTQAENVILRLANVVGADSLAGALKNDAPVKLDQFEDGYGPRRSYLSAGDFLNYIRAMAHCTTGILPPVLNVASVARIGMDDLSRAAGKEIVWQPAPPQALQNVTLDVSNLKRLIPRVTPLQTAPELISVWQELEAMA